MPDKYPKSVFAKKKDQKSPVFRRRLLAGGALLSSLIIALLILSHFVNLSRVAEHFGFILNKRLGTIAPGLVLGQEDVFGLRSVSAKKKKAQKRPFGIAAGGGLTYLDQNSLNKYFKSLKSLGVKWVRWDIDWSVVQKENSENYDWHRVDRVVEMARKYGINSLGIITYAPKWAAPESCGSDSKCEPADPEAFGRFAGEAARRYKDTISFWEIWNEPNLTHLWGPRSNAIRYAEVLKEAYLEIKKENPQATVLSGGLASTGNDDNGNISPMNFLKTLYEVGANQYFDAVALHPYTFPVLPSYKKGWNHWQDILPVRQLMDDNSDGSKRIWITEFGAPTGGPGKSFATNKFRKFKFGTDYMKKSAQCKIMEEAISFYRDHTDWMGPLFWYSLRDASSNKSDTENFFGLLRYDGSEKPAYEVYKNAIISEENN